MLRNRRSKLRAKRARRPACDRICRVLALSAQAYANSRERPVKTDILRFACLETDIHRVEEHVRAIAEADFRIGIAERKPRETAEIWHDDGPALGSMTGVWR